MNKKNFKEFADKIGVEFKNIKMLEQAFVHRSYINENGKSGLEHNERLEFLGDAVLELSAIDGIKGMASDLVKELKEIASGEKLTDKELMDRFSFNNTKKIVEGVGNVVVGAGQASLAATWGYGVTNTQQGKATEQIKKDIQDNQDKKMQDIATAGVKAAQDS